MKKRKNEMGFGSYEFLTVAVVCLVFTTILLKMSLDNGNREKFRVFKYNAKIVGLNSVNYQMGQKNNVIYLIDMINDGLISPVKNPFSGESFCDAYESKVEFLEEQKYVTLKCGPYLIDKHNLSEDDITVYKVGEWSNDTSSNAEKKVLYNCKQKEKEILDNFYEEELFLSLLNKKTNNEYKSIYDIKNNCLLQSKTVYRKREKITNIK